MLDFKENIDLLEKLIFNFIITEDGDGRIYRPDHADVLDKREIISLIKPNYWTDDTISKIYKIVRTRFLETSKIPSIFEVKTLAKVNNILIPEILIDSLYAVDLLQYGYDTLYKYTKSFIFYKNLNNTLIEVLSELKTTSITPENVEIITNEVRDKFNVKLNLSLTDGDSGLNFFNSADHTQLSKIGNPTGFKFFDKVLDGGWNPKTLVVFQGRPKVGKSMVLSNIAARAFASGCITGVATLELSDRKYMKRIGSCLLDIPFKEYDGFLNKSDTNIVETRINLLKENNKSLGELYVKEFPTGTASAIDIENYFLKIEKITGKKFTVIIVDYLNLMRPIKEQGNIYEKIKVISEELRAVAIRNGWCIISATQIKREAVDDQDLGMTDVAESFGLIHTVDSLFGLIRGPMEKRMKIKLIANRDGGYIESYKMFKMNYDFARLAEEVDPASEYYSDDDDTQSLETQMSVQYKNIQTQTTDITTILETSTPSEILPNENFDKPNTSYRTSTDYDDILNSL